MIYASKVWLKNFKRPKRRWNSNTKMDPNEIRLDSGFTSLTTRTGGSCEHGNVPWSSTKTGNYLTKLQTISLSKYPTANY